MEELFQWAQEKNFLKFSLIRIQQYQNNKKTKVFFWEAEWLFEIPSFKGPINWHRVKADTFEELKELVMNESKQVVIKAKPKGGLL